MEAEIRARYPDSKVKLIEGGGGIFNVTCDGKLIFSKHKVAGQRFPNSGEVSKLIEQETGKK